MAFSARSLFAPLAPSRKTVTAPATVRATICASTLWPSVNIGARLE
jgi:hypothetical protein